MREPRWQISSRARGAGEKQSDDGLTAQTKKSAERCHIGKGAKFIHNRAHLDAPTPPSSSKCSIHAHVHGSQTLELQFLSMA